MVVEGADAGGGAGGGETGGGPGSGSGSSSSGSGSGEAWRLLHRRCGGGCCGGDGGEDGGEEEGEEAEAKDGSGEEHALEVDGTRLRWTVPGSASARTYECGARVADARLVAFEGVEGTCAVVSVDAGPSVLRTFAVGGAQWDTVLPFRPRRLWALASVRALLVEAEATADAQQIQPTNHPCSYFVLRHPLDAPLPVLGENGLVLNESIVAVDETDGLPPRCLLTFDADNNIHRLRTMAWVAASASSPTTTSSLAFADVFSPTPLPQSHHETNEPVALQCTTVWRSVGAWGAQRATTGFVATNASGERVVVLLHASATTLSESVAMTGPTTATATATDGTLAKQTNNVLDAVPVSVSPHVVDVLALVVETHSALPRLELRRGAAGPVLVPDLRSLVPDAVPTDPVRVQWSNLRHGLVDVVAASGARTRVRLKRPDASRSAVDVFLRAALLADPLVASALAIDVRVWSVALSRALSSSSGSRLRTDAELVRVARLLAAYSPCVSDGTAAVDVTYVALAMLLAKLCAAASTTTSASSAPGELPLTNTNTTTTNDDDEDAWTALLHSGFHARTSLADPLPLLLASSAMPIPPRTLDRDNDVDSFLLQNKDSPFIATPAATFAVALPAIIRFAHAAYEEARLDRLSHARVSGRLAETIAGLARAALPPSIAGAFADHYNRDVPGRWRPLPLRSVSPTAQATAHGWLPIPDAWDMLTFEFDGASPGGGTDNPPATFLSALPAESFPRLTQAVRVVRSLAVHGHAAAATELLGGPLRHRADAEALPLSLRVILREALHRCRESPPEGWSAKAYAAISRDDVARTSGDASPSPLAKSPFPRTTTTTGGKLPPGLAIAPTTASVRKHLLASDAPHKLGGVERRPEMTDHHFVAAQQRRLRALVERAAAAAVGRGALDLGTAFGGTSTTRHLTSVPISPPTLNLSGVVPPLNTPIQLDLTGVSGVPPPDDAHANAMYPPPPPVPLALAWPQFHNGAAAGLATCFHARSGFGALGNQQDAYQQQHQDEHDMTRAWILASKPKQPSDAHAGVLLALGMSGHLATLTMADVYEHLAPGHETTAVAVLLGMACSRVGSADATISKALCLHVPSLLPPVFADLDVSPQVQTAAVAGLGVLYRGTAHRLMAEFLLDEIGRSPSSDRIVEDRDAYALAAGLALGLVCLGQARKESGLAGLADVGLEERLHVLMGGLTSAGLAARTSRGVSAARAPSGSSYGGGGGSRGGSGGGSSGEDSQGGPRGGDEPLGRGAAATAAALAAADSAAATACARVFEGVVVNTDASAPGAALALALVYFKSNDAAVAARLAVPETRFECDFVRPDMMTVRVWARSLVAWDSVVPSEAWVREQVPACLAGGVPAADGAVWDGLDSSLGVRLARSASSSSTSRGATTDEATAESWQESHWLAQARMHCVAGACLGIGTRFAGSGSLEARDVLLTRVRGWVQAFPRAWEAARAKARRGVTATSGVTAAALRASAAAALSNGDEDAPVLGTVALEMCLCAAVSALGMVMAGTGDTATLMELKRARELRGVRYGTHMAIGMALGMLHLGGGRAAFATSDEAIAMLVCAVFPRFPLTPSDNSAHLQALRQLYALAVETRACEAVDVDTNEPCVVPLAVELDVAKMPRGVDPSRVWSGSPTSQAMFSDALVSAAAPTLAEGHGTVLRVVAPALLPPAEWIKSVRVASPRYWPYVVRPPWRGAVVVGGGDDAGGGFRLACKLRAHQLPYAVDPQGVSGLGARPVSLAGEAAAAEGDPLLAFGQTLGVAALLRHIPRAVLHEALVHDKLDSLAVMIEVESSSVDPRQLHVLRRFYSSRAFARIAAQLPTPRVVGEASLARAVRDHPASTTTRGGKSFDADVAAYVASGELPLDETRRRAFVAWLNLVGVPPAWVSRSLVGGGELTQDGGHANAVLARTDPDALLELCRLLSSSLSSAVFYSYS